MPFKTTGARLRRFLPLLVRGHGTAKVLPFHNGPGALSPQDLRQLVAAMID